MAKLYRQNAKSKRLKKIEKISDFRGFQSPEVRRKKEI
jgi:hypothetical protein